jgi:hypothetical protein
MRDRVTCFRASRATARLASAPATADPCCAPARHARARATHACHTRARVTRPCQHDSQCVRRTRTTCSCPNDTLAARTARARLACALATLDSTLKTHTSARAICSRARATRDSHGSLVGSHARPHDKHAPARHWARPLCCLRC